MSATTLPSELLRRFQVGLRSNRIGQLVYNVFVEAVNTKPPTAWVKTSIKDSLIVSGEADGVFDWVAGSGFGRIAVDDGRTIDFAHIHMDKAHAGGTLTLELYINVGQTFGPGSTPGTMTRIATASVVAGEADGASVSFTFANESDKIIPSGAYIHAQATAEPAGSGWVGFLDIHYAEQTT